jgi:hypothetical protein
MSGAPLSAASGEERPLVEAENLLQKAKKPQMGWEIT